MIALIQNTGFLLLGLFIGFLLGEREAYKNKKEN